MSYQIAVDIADEWEDRVRQYRKDHPKKRTVLTEGLRSLLERDIDRRIDPMSWSTRAIANKALEILSEKLGEPWGKA